MGKITDIKPQSRNKSRVSLYIDGEFFCGLEKLTVLSCRLHIGDEVNPERLAEASAESERTAAFDKAARYLGVRPRTEKEMTTYLTDKGFSEHTTSHTVQKLKEYGYVNDADFCRAYIDAYKHKSGVRKLEAELRNKGVTRDIIDEALRAAFEDSDEQAEAARRLAEKYLASHKRDKRKVAVFLAGRGFDYDTVKEALRAFDFSREEGEED